MSTNPPDQSGPEPVQQPQPDPAQPVHQQPPDAAQPQAPQYQQPQQYARPQPFPVPQPQPMHPPVAERPIGGGLIWLGIVIAVLVPFLMFWLGNAIDSAASARGDFGTGWNLLLLLIGFLGALIAAIVLTILVRTRRTGIGMWIGIAALPIIAFGVCTAMLFGSGL